jgi:hypothetical protein
MTRRRKTITLAAASVVALTSGWVSTAQAASAQPNRPFLRQYHFNQITEGAEFDDAVIRVQGGPNGSFDLTGHLKDTGCDGKTPMVTVTDWIGHVLKTAQDHTGCGGFGTDIHLSGGQGTNGVQVITCVIGRSCSARSAFSDG